ncbi:MAG TPA: LAGLIDADG family homing endonuclease, partial [Methylobacter sp.]
EAGYGKARIYKIPEKNACKVICDNLSLLDLCRFHCGSLAELKKLSHELFNAAPEQLFEFLGAYWNGDGCFTNNSYTAGSVSQEMAHQIHQMLRRLGIPSYYSTYDPKLYNIKKPISENRFPISYVSFPGHYQNIFGQYAKFVSGTYDASSTIVYTVKTDIGFLHRVESISYERYVGKVHNIEVRSEGMAKSYIAFGLATHNSHPIVGAAIDFHTDVPISKLRLSLPKGQDKKKCKQILAFYEKMCKRLRLFQTLYDATHQYWLQGIAYIFAEDHDLSTEVPEDALFDVSEEEIGTVDYAGRTEKKKNKIRVPKSKEERDKIVRDLVSKKYEGWKRLQILPPEQVKVEVFQYTDKIKMELLPSEKDRQLVLKAQDMSDPEASRIADTIPKQIREELLNGQPIPLDTSPYADFLCSSFCFELAHKKPPFEARGVPILERCLRTLIYQDKLRQAQTSIASRAMTPKRIVWMDKASEIDVEDLRGQIDQALIDPDFSIISNTEIHWDEIGSRDRLLDLSTEYEITNKLLFIGLRITESMLTGESTYSGERIHLDVMNTMYLLYREIISSYVEDYLFAPVAEKKGFWEEDEQGNRTLLYPRLQFTRLALRDNAELQDFMFNLYQKGSLPISYLYELMNVDSEDAHDELKRDLWTQKDATFNEFIRAVLTGAGEKMIDESNILEVLAQNSGLKRNNKSGNRFGKD